MLVPIPLFFPVFRSIFLKKFPNVFDIRFVRYIDTAFPNELFTIPHSPRWPKTASASHPSTPSSPSSNSNCRANTTKPAATPTSLVKHSSTSSNTTSKAKFPTSTCAASPVLLRQARLTLEPSPAFLLLNTRNWHN